MANSTLLQDQESVSPEDSTSIGGKFSNRLRSFLNQSMENKTKEGQEQKRRGPKPDSKPPVSRRQALNRQAQRQHRIRKEQYTKRIEEELVKNKQMLADEMRRRISVEQENRFMKTLLDVNGIAYYGGKMATAQSSGPQLVPYDSSHSGSQNRLSTLSPTTASESISNPVSSNAPMGRRLGGEPSESLQTGHMQAVVADETFRYGFVPTTETHPTQAPMAQIPSANNGTVDVVLTSHDEKEIAEKIHKGPWFDKCSLSDRDGMALAFIAAVEDSCHTHASMMQQNIIRDTPIPSGHASMMTVASYKWISENPQMGAEYGRGKSFAPTLPKADMMRLLNNAKSLTINGEVTPVMAWDMLSKDERFDYLSIADFERLTKDLKGRCRCYGFGAVLEDIEVDDAIDRIFAIKMGQLHV